MIIDLQGQFDAKLALGPGIATTASTNSIDLGPQATNFGVGEDMSAVIEVYVAPVATAGTETYVVTLNGSATKDGSMTAIGTVTIPRTATAGGQNYVIPIPNMLGSNLRWLSLSYALAGNADAAITLTAQLLPNKMIEAYTTYQSGYSIL